MKNQTDELTGRISMEEVREMGEVMGILSVNKFECKTDLIRVIQLADGHEPCFNADGLCRSRLCMWASECLVANKGHAA